MITQGELSSINLVKIKYIVDIIKYIKWNKKFQFFRKNNHVIYFKNVACIPIKLFIHSIVLSFQVLHTLILFYLYWLIHNTNSFNPKFLYSWFSSQSQLPLNLISILIPNLFYLLPIGLILFIHLIIPKPSPIPISRTLVDSHDKWRWTRKIWILEV